MWSPCHTDKSNAPLFAGLLEGTRYTYCTLQAGGLPNSSPKKEELAWENSFQEELRSVCWS